VGTFAPNKWGLYDMHGNVEEWCWDWYDADYYESGPDQDPHGPASGSERVVRGGRWSDPGKWLRSAYRYMWGPGYFGSGMGFRLVCSEGQ
jgi:formylglycine-generating enzyme required for sulfatase activity